MTWTKHGTARQVGQCIEPSLLLPRSNRQADHAVSSLVMTPLKCLHSSHSPTVTHQRLPYNYCQCSLANTSGNQRSHRIGCQDAHQSMSVLHDLICLAFLIITARLGLGSNLPATPPRSLPPTVRYTAGTVSLALFTSLLYILYALRSHTPLIPLGSPCLNHAYWLCIPRRALALSHPMC